MMVSIDILENPGKCNRYQEMIEMLGEMSKILKYFWSSKYKNIILCSILQLFFKSALESFQKY